MIDGRRFFAADVCFGRTRMRHHGWSFSRLQRLERGLKTKTRVAESGGGDSRLPHWRHKPYTSASSSLDDRPEPPEPATTAPPTFRGVLAHHPVSEAFGVGAVFLEANAWVKDAHLEIEGGSDVDR